MTKSKTSRFFEPLAVAVASGHSIKAAADVAGCAVQTAYNLSSSPEFRRRVTEIRSEICARAVGRLADSAALAADTLAELCGASNPPAVRATAAKSILAALPGLSEYSELRQRIDSLESGDFKLKVAK